MNAVIVDASVAIKWPLIEPYTTEARALRDYALRQAIPMIVPALFGYEVVSVLNRKISSGLLTLADTQLALVDILTVVQIRNFSRTLSMQALEIAQITRQKLAYDAQYVALARRLNCAFWTADKQLYDAAQAEYPQVHWIGASVPLD